MHVLGNFLRKVHYNALFGVEKYRKSLPPELSGAEFAETQRKDLRETGDRERPRRVFNLEGEFPLSPLFA
jgi:hypothetical protein